MNEIPTVQNTPENLALRRAAFETYEQAKLLAGVQVFIVAVLPIASSIMGLLFKDLRPTVAVISLFALALDVFWLDRTQKELVTLGAKASEKFDCAVLKMSWNPVAAGQPPNEASVKKYDLQFRESQRSTEMSNWYPASVGAAPLHLARIICQLTNAQYDGRLRPLYRRALAGTSISIFVALLLASVLMRLAVSDLLITVLLPCAPFLAWSVREFRRHGEANNVAQQVEEHSLRLWSEAVDGLAPSKCAQRSRSVQDLIYQHRSRAPLPVPLIYNLFRQALERKMNTSATDRLREIGLGGDEQ